VNLDFIFLADAFFDEELHDVPSVVALQLDD